MGIDAEGKLYINRELLEIHDGPMPKALQNIQGGRMARPSSEECRPDRDYLAERFEDFSWAA